MNLPKKQRIQLMTLVKAGYSLEEALEMVEHDEKDRKRRKSRREKENERG